MPDDLFLFSHGTKERLDDYIPAIGRLLRHLRTKSYGMVLPGDGEEKGERSGLAVGISPQGTHVVVGAIGY